MGRTAAWCAIVWVGVVAPAYAQNTTTRVSVATDGTMANNFSEWASISGDGRFVAFRSRANTLVSGDTNNFDDVFVHDRQAKTTERVSLTAAGFQATGGHSEYPSISGDGRFVAFLSAATNLVPNDTNGVADVFVRDRQAATTIRVSVSSSGVQALTESQPPVISNGGRYVAFASRSGNLVAGDTNGELDVFRHDRQTGTTIRINIGLLGAQPTGGGSVSPAISADGSIVSFISDATNLVANDTNQTLDVFVRDVTTSTTTRVSVGPGGVQANGTSIEASISFDGRFVAFFADATNLVPGGRAGIYLRDRQDNVTSALSLRAPGSDSITTPNSPRISGDGRYVCFSLFAGTGKFFELFLLDRQTLNKSRVTVGTNGEPGDDGGGLCSVNADATVIAFESLSTNLIDNDFNGQLDIFVRTMFATSALEKTALTFGATTSGGTFVSQTPAQSVRLTQSGVGSVTWTATSNQPWLQVSPASGAGSATLTIGVTPATALPPSGTVTGQITIALTGAANTLPPIAVTLTLVPSGTTLAPFGIVDTPTNNRTGVTGAVPFTGWALDDLEVARVSICRDAFGAEVAPIDPNCGGAAQIFVGFAVFIDGARPDVASAFPEFPLATRGGWGFMVLTNMLPGQGNGTYRFTMRAQDREGAWAVLGTRTMTCANASATLPFGTLDTPFQGGSASSASYVNFGWVLTPQPKTIPIDGSTIRVLVDGVSIGTADYNHARPDIQALFPGFNNTNGAVGFHILDTTLLENGVHTISWAVTDNQGAIEGIGSRFFTVSNGTSAVTAAATAARSDQKIDAVPLDPSSLVGRRGWDLEAPYGVFGAGATGVVTIRSEEVSRVELQLGEGEHKGYLRTAAGFAPLPIGSRLDPASQTFTWAPGVGFVGRYDFVFVRSTNGRAIARREVRIILHPKGRGAVGPQVVIDVPRANATVASPFMIGGWAVDLDAPEGTGVTTLHAWAFPAAGGAPIFLGATAYGGARPDVAAVHGDRFKDSGFGLIVQGLPAADYDLALFAWSTETVGFVAPTMVRVRVTQ
jgi:hypothetical protein